MYIERLNQDRQLKHIQQVIRYAREHNSINNAAMGTNNKYSTPFRGH